MIPLSCINCCHNPLQLGSVGTVFGYCTRHRAVLNQPQLTTCGQLLRKDLLADSGRRQRAIHSQSFAPDHIATVADPDRSASKAGLVEKPNGQLPPDPVIEEVQNFGNLDSRIASMAALHRVPGARAEVAMLSLSRAYFGNCVARGGPWTAGVHLLYWTLGRLDADPALGATDLRGPIAFSLGHTIAVARWSLIAFRLAFVSDVGQEAESVQDRAGRLARLAGQAVKAAPGTDPDRLLDWLGKKKPGWSTALSAQRYAEIREQLHRTDPDAMA
jgi:hypothetical protein